MSPQILIAVCGKNRKRNQGLSIGITIITKKPITKKCCESTNSFQSILSLPEAHGSGMELLRTIPRHLKVPKRPQKLAKNMILKKCSVLPGWIMAPRHRSMPCCPDLHFMAISDSMRPMRKKPSNKNLLMLLMLHQKSSGYLTDLILYL